MPLTSFTIANPVYPNILFKRLRIIGWDDVRINSDLSQMRVNSPSALTGQEVTDINTEITNSEVTNVDARNATNLSRADTARAMLEGVNTTVAIPNGSLSNVLRAVVEVLRDVDKY